VRAVSAAAIPAPRSASISGASVGSSAAACSSARAAGGERLHRRALALREPLERVGRERAQAVGMREARRLARQLLSSPSASCASSSSRAAWREIVAALGEGRERIREALGLAFGLAQRGQRLRVARAFRLEPGEPVERDERRAFAQQALVLVLAVEVEQDLAQALERGLRHRRLVHRGPALPSGLQLAPHDQRLAVELQLPLGEQRRRARGGLAREPELALDHCRRGAVAHHVGVGAAAHQQAHRLDQQRLAGAGPPPSPR
jgi:hypothetical protein